jgi:hypothetical protein
VNLPGPLQCGIRGSNNPVRAEAGPLEQDASFGPRANLIDTHVPY